jgi:hypothetical protein
VILACVINETNKAGTTITSTAAADADVDAADADADADADAAAVSPPATAASTLVRSEFVKFNWTRVIQRTSHSYLPLLCVRLLPILFSASSKPRPFNLDTRIR